jgi:FkbM family methyltransferase
MSVRVLSQPVSPAPERLRKQPGIIASCVYNAFVATAPLAHRPRTAALWKKMLSASHQHLSGPVRTKIHASNAIVNFGYMYPILSRMYKEYNSPIIETIFQTSRVFGSALYVVDVGAAVGDTSILASVFCGDMIEQIVCIEGNQEFFSFLHENALYIKNPYLIAAVLSSSCGYERSLVKLHPGTASSQGGGFQRSIPLDDVVRLHSLGPIHVVKIDVDGFDGRVIAGSRRTLDEYRPSVIFEWQPLMLRETSNSALEPFEILNELGYDRFLWFTKYGQFSHFSSILDSRALLMLSDMCCREKMMDDRHYDVVALHRSSSVSHIDLAELQFARSRLSNRSADWSRRASHWMAQLFETLGKAGSGAPENPRP